MAGSVVMGPSLAWLFLRVTDRVHHVPTAIILQFVSTFGVWIVAEQIGLSGVLTMVCYAIAVARTAARRYWSPMLIIFFIIFASAPWIAGKPPACWQ